MPVPGVVRHFHGCHHSAGNFGDVFRRQAVCQASTRTRFFLPAAACGYLPVLFLVFVNVPSDLYFYPIFHALWFGPLLGKGSAVYSVGGAGGDACHRPIGLDHYYLRHCTGHWFTWRRRAFGCVWHAADVRRYLCHSDCNDAVVRCAVFSASTVLTSVKNVLAQEDGLPAAE